MPNLVRADDTYNFTNTDVPENSTEEKSGDEYSEDLWEVTDSGVYNEKGEQVTAPITIIQPPFSGAGQNTGSENSTSSGSAKTSTAPQNEVMDAYQQTLINNFGTQKASAENRLSGIKQSLEAQKKRFEEMNEKIDEAEDKLAPIREEMTDLKTQIELINKQVRITKEKITNVEIMIAEKQIQIKEALLFLQKNKIEMNVQKDMVLDYVKLLYQEEHKFFDLYDQGTSTVKLLLADNSVSENLLGEEYFSVMEEAGREVFHGLDATRQELIEKQEIILREQEDLKYLYEQLSNEKKSYEESRLTKKALLEQTQGEEEKYNLLLEQAQQQQLEAAISVKNLQDNLVLIAGKLNALDDTSAQVEAVINAAGDQVLETPTSDKPFIWPVPANKITARFRDPSYPAKWGYHNAIDIRAKQYTPIKAPAHGYVYKAQNNGMGYSYIVLAHKDNLVTVFGHVSDIQVVAGQVVKQGEVIGLSGGTPGTKGAGLQTTGAHLHFEVHKNGVAVDALPYLPVEQLPLEYVPNDYLNEVKKILMEKANTPQTPSPNLPTTSN